MVRPQGERVKGEYLTNYYEYKQSQTQADIIYLYEVIPTPLIPADSLELWYRVIESAEQKLKRSVEPITYRANTLWGAKKVETSFTIPTIVKDKRRGPKQNGGPPQKYSLLIKLTKAVGLRDLYESEDSKAKPLLVQMVNNSIKQRMFALGFFELGKGRFYCKN